MDLVQAIQGIPGIGPFLPYIMAAIAIAAVVARFLPPPSVPASGVYPILYGIVNTLAQNGGHAANASAPAAKPPAPPAAALLGLLLAALALSACAGTTIQAQTEVALTGAERLALGYATLPACPQPAGTLCADAATVAKIKAADNVAYAAVQAAKAGTLAPADAMAAVAGLAALIPASK